MLIMIIVYLIIGVIITFGPARKDLFELVKEDTLAVKIGQLVIWTITAPVLFVYGAIKELIH